MIIRITTALGKKIHAPPARTLPLDPNPLVDWSARLFTAERIQYILLTNTACLYSAVMYGRGITHEALLLKRTVSTLSEAFRDEGLEAVFEQAVAPATDQVTLAKALNRSVTGSINDLVFQAEIYRVEGRLSLPEVAAHLNICPMSLLNHDSPRKSLQKLIQPSSAGKPAWEGGA